MGLFGASRMIPGYTGENVRNWSGALPEEEFQPRMALHGHLPTGSSAQGMTELSRMLLESAVLETTGFAGLTGILAGTPTPDFRIPVADRPLSFDNTKADAAVNAVRNNAFTPTNEKALNFLEGISPVIAKVSDTIDNTAVGIEDATGLPRELIKGVAQAGVELIPPSAALKIASKFNADVPSVPGNFNQSGMIKAFHGTPHKVDKFSSKNIGTGEGAQAYGHGLYFADSPDVARSYGGGNSIDNTRDIASWAIGSVGEKNAVSALRTGKGLNAGMPQSLLDDAADLIDSGKYKPQGNLYNVNLDVNPEDLLDWDAPLSGQSQKVQDAINKIIADNPDNMGIEATSKYDMEGRHIYDRLEGLAGRNNEGGASELLRNNGILGNQYLDGMSRGAGEGTRNYVIFDDKLIDINDPNKGLLGDGSQRVKPGSLGEGIKGNKGVDEYKEKILRTKEVMPIEVDNTGFIIDGEHRYKALMDLGVDDIPVFAGKQMGHSGRLEKGYSGISVPVTIPNKGLPMDEAARMRRAEEMGFNRDVYHATTHDIKEFDLSKANPESDLGAGIYTTNTLDDATSNYSHIDGQDLTQKIEMRAEQLEYDLGDMDVAREAAKKELYGGQDQVMELKARIDKPVYVGGDKQTFIEMDYPEYDPKDFLDEAGGDMDLAEDLASDARYAEEPEGQLVDLTDSLRNQAGSDADGAISAIYEEGIHGGLSADRIIEIIKDSDLIYYEMPDGSLGGNELIRQAFEDAGFDGFIDQAPYNKWGWGSGRSNAMDGLHEGTEHVIPFKPNQLRLKDATFDPAKADSSDLMSSKRNYGLLANYA